MAKIEISVTGEVEEFFKGLRDQKGFKSLSEAVEYALPIAKSRIAATSKYAKDHKPAAKPRKAAAPKAKKTSKGPLARKVKAAAPKAKKAKKAPAAAPAATPAPATPATAPVLD